MLKVINSLIEFQSFVIDFIKNLKPEKEKATLVGLYGNLGAGKTEFVKTVCRTLGLNQAIISPTFVIMKIYKIENSHWTNIIHIDAYRIEDSKEVDVLGLEDILKDENNLVFIEWPEKIIDKIGQDHIKIFIKNTDNSGREIEIKNEKQR